MFKHIDWKYLLLGLIIGSTIAITFIKIYKQFKK